MPPTWVLIILVGIIANAVWYTIACIRRAHRQQAAAIGRALESNETRSLRARFDTGYVPSLWSPGRVAVDPVANVYQWLDQQRSSIFIGTQGPQGEPRPIGLQGLQGFQGPQGPSGAHGPPSVRIPPPAVVSWTTKYGESRIYNGSPVPESRVMPDPGKYTAVLVDEYDRLIPGGLPAASLDPSQPQVQKLPVMREDLAPKLLKLYHLALPPNLNVHFVPANGQWHTYKQQRRDIEIARATKVVVITTSPALLNDSDEELAAAVETIVAEQIRLSVEGGGTEAEFEGVLSMARQFELYPASLEHRSAVLVRYAGHDVKYAYLGRPQPEVLELQPSGQLVMCLMVSLVVENLNVEGISREANH